MSQSLLFAFGGAVSLVVFGGLFVYAVMTMKRMEASEITPPKRDANG